MFPRFKFTPSTSPPLLVTTTGCTLSLWWGTGKFLLPTHYFPLLQHQSFTGCWESAPPQSTSSFSSTFSLTSSSYTFTSALGVPSVLYHSFYFFLHSLAFFALSEMCFPKVLSSWLRDQPCPVMGPWRKLGLAVPSTWQPWPFSQASCCQPCHLSPTEPVWPALLQSGGKMPHQEHSGSCVAVSPYQQSGQITTG